VSRGVIGAVVLCHDLPFLPVKADHEVPGRVVPEQVAATAAGPDLGEPAGLGRLLRNGGVS
jgi:hypothetical protein